MMGLKIVTVLVAVFVCFSEIGNAAHQMVYPEMPEDSEGELPSHRRSTRISRISASDDNDLATSSDGVSKRAKQFDQTGPTKDDTKIADFWRNYGKILEMNTNDEVELEKEVEREALEEEDMTAGSKAKSGHIKKGPLHDLNDEAEVEGDDIVSPSPIENSTPQYTGRSEDPAGNVQSPTGPQISTINGMPMPLPYQPSAPNIPMGQPPYHPGNIVIDPQRMPLFPWPPYNYIHPDGHSSVPASIPIPPSMTTAGYFPNHMIGFYPFTDLHPSPSSPSDRQFPPKHIPYKLPSPASEMISIPGRGSQTNFDPATQEAMPTERQPIPVHTGYPFITPAGFSPYQSMPFPQFTYEGVPYQYQQKPFPGSTSNTQPMTGH